MKCKFVEYENFRNIKRQRIEFCDGVNVIEGKNAQGKTNSLEGIYLCASGRSHRTTKDKHFIGFGSEFGRITLSYEDSRRENTLEMRFGNTGRKYCSKNGVAQKKLSEFVGNFKAVLFTPEHLSIVKSGPSARREFLDAAISQLSKEYLCSVQRYEKILANRNKILQNKDQLSKSYVKQLVDPYTEMLTKEAEYVGKCRKQYVEALERSVKQTFDLMTGGKENVSLTYSNIYSREELYEIMNANFEKEFAAKTTLYGTHKDDIEITVNEAVARSFASQGQQRSIALAMKLAEGYITYKDSGEEPVYLLDDVLSELDGVRKEFILSSISGKQVILTTCDKIESIGANVIHCEDGVFTRG